MWCFFSLSKVVFTLLGESGGRYQRLNSSILFWIKVARVCMHIKVQVPIAPRRPINVVSVHKVISQCCEALHDQSFRKCWKRSIFWQHSGIDTCALAFLLVQSHPKSDVLAEASFAVTLRRYRCAVSSQMWLTLTVEKVINLSFPRKLAPEHLDV